MTEPSRGHVPLILEHGSCKFRIWETGTAGARSEFPNMLDYLESLDEIMASLKPAKGNTGGVSTVERQRRFSVYLMRYRYELMVE